jgi:hypothetical protein
MAKPGHAVAAAATDHVAFTGNEFSRSKVVHVRPDLNDLADELVADDHRNGNRLSGPFVPGEDVNVGPANPGSQDAYQNIVNAEKGFRDILKPQAGLRVRFDKGFQIDLRIYPVAG